MKRIAIFVLFSFAIIMITGCGASGERRALLNVLHSVNNGNAEVYFREFAPRTNDTQQLSYDSLEEIGTILAEISSANTTVTTLDWQTRVERDPDYGIYLVSGVQEVAINQWDAPDGLLEARFGNSDKYFRYWQINSTELREFMHSNWANQR